MTSCFWPCSCRPFPPLRIRFSPPPPTPEFLTGMGSQHPSPNVKTFCNFEAQIWLEIITSRMRCAKSACFKGSRTSCREIIFGIFWPNFGQKRSHHVMDASCRLLRIFRLQPGPEWKSLLRRTWSGQKLLPLQFRGLSLP